MVCGQSIGAATFKGWVTGIFFKQGDLVDLIYRGTHIYAVYNQQQELIAMRPAVLSGIRFQLKLCPKVFK